VLIFEIGISPIHKNMFPHTLTDLHLGRDSGHDFPSDLPQSLKELRVYKPHLQQMRSLNHLNQLRVLFLDKLKCPLDTPFPQSLESLTISSCKIYIGKGILPEGLKTFHFEYDYEHELYAGMFPNSITHLTLCGRIDANNEQLDAILPKSLTKLNITQFLSPIPPRFLPESVEEIRMHPLFNSELMPGCLPSKLKKLIFNYTSNFYIQPDLIPASVTYLSLSESLDQAFADTNGLNFLPPNLTHLKMGGGDHSVRGLGKDVLPKTLKYLWLPLIQFFVEPDTLPSSIETLFFNTSASVLVPNVIPPSVTKLVLLKGFHSEIQQYALPNSITNLSLRSRYGHPLPRNVLPESLNTLSISYFDLSNTYLPNSLTQLTLDLDDSQTLPQGLIPNSVKILIINGYKIRDSLKKENFPPNLHYLRLSVNFSLESDMLPTNLSILNLGSYFSSEILPGSIPLSVQYIYLPSNYNLKKANLPPTTIIKLGEYLSANHN